MLYPAGTAMFNNKVFSGAVVERNVACAATCIVSLRSMFLKLEGREIDFSWKDVVSSRYRTVAKLGMSEERVITAKPAFWCKYTI